MLKELKAIGEYVMGKSSPIESLITIPGGDYYIINLLYDGEKFVFDEIPKQGDVPDLVAMCFKPGKATAQSFLPNGYLSLDDHGEIDGIHKIIGSLGKLKNDYGWCLDIIFQLQKNFAIYNIDSTKSLLTTIPKKDANKKMVMSICGLQLSKAYVMSLGLTPLVEKAYLYFGEIKEFQDYFLAKNQGEGAVLMSGFCHVCELQKTDLINFTKSTGVNFEYKFYNLDKPGFAYGMEKDNGPQSFGVCQGCYTTIKSGYTYFKTMSKNILGSKAYVFPSFHLSSGEQKKVFEMIEKYSNLDQLDENIKAKVEQGELTTDMFDIFSSHAQLEEQEILNNFVKMNFLFGQIDGAKSDELKIKYFLKDILPSRLGKLYASIKLFNRKFDPINNTILVLAQQFFTQTEWQEKNYATLPDLYIYPTFEKGQYVFNLKNFLTLRSNGDEPYYQFLDIFLHNGAYPPGEFWSLVYEKIITDFTKIYLIEKKGNLKKSLREIYLFYNYLLNNKLLSHISSPMTVSFTTDHVGLLAIQDYANQHHFTQDAVYIALVGMYFKLCVAKQKKEVGTSPLMTEINFARMDYDHLIKLLNKARDKFNKYSGKKFAYYPALYRQILELGLHLDHTVGRDQMAYYFGLGMEILPDIYFTAMKQKSEDKTYHTELEEASNDDEIN